MLLRGLRWIREQLAFLAVLLGLAAGFGYLVVEPDRWRPGIAVIAGTLLAAALLRLVVRTSGVGFLAVRARAIDVGFYLLLGGLILAVDIRLHS